MIFYPKYLFFFCSFYGWLSKKSFRHAGNRKSSLEGLYLRWIFLAGSGRRGGVNFRQGIQGVKKGLSKNHTLTNNTGGGGAR